MLGWSCRHTRRRIGHLVLGTELPAPDAAALWKELRRCSRCRRLYDRAIRFRRLLSTDWQNVVDPAAGELEAFSQRVVAIATAGSGKRPSWSELSSIWRWGIAAATAAVLVVALQIAISDRPDKGRVTARSTSRSFALRLLCDTQDTQGRPIVRSISDDPTTEELSDCPQPGVFAFAYTATAPGYLYVLEENTAGLHWHWPSSGSGEPIRLDSTTELTLVDIVLPPPGGQRSERHVLFAWCREPLVTGPGGAADPQDRAELEAVEHCTIDARVLRYPPFEER